MKKVLYSFALILMVVLTASVFVGCQGVSNPKLESMTRAAFETKADEADTAIKKDAQVTLANLTAKLGGGDLVKKTFYKNYRVPGASQDTQNVICFSWANNTNESSASKYIKVYLVATGATAFANANSLTGTTTGKVIHISYRGIPAA